MAYGFRPSYNFEPIVGWELYQVTLDKYHVMFFFNNGHDLMNVAHSFTLGSPEGRLYRYEIYGANKLLNVDSILRQRVTACRVKTISDLDLHFANNYVLTVHDNPDLRSWWFIGNYSENGSGGCSPEIAALSDIEADLLTDKERRERNA